MSTGIEAAFSGRLGGDAELKMVKGGTLPMIAFPIAVDTKDDSEPTTWCRVVRFGPEAEDLAHRLMKGTRAYVEGKLKLDRWIAQDGTERSGLSVTASTIQPLGQIGKRKPRKPRAKKAEAPDAGAAAQAPLESPPPGHPAALPFDDDLPSHLLT